MKLEIRSELFWDVDPARIDEQLNRRLIIERVFSYGNVQEIKTILDLTYFDDLDLSDWPNLVLEKDLTIEKVKSTLIHSRNQFLR